MSAQSAAVGIDLGGQQACIAVMRDKNKAHVILGTDGQLKTPAYISYSLRKFGPKTFRNLVGTEAKSAMSNQQKGVYNPRRLLGKNFHDPDVLEFMKQASFPIINENGTPKMEMHFSYWKNEKTFFHPEEITGKLLMHLKCLADQFLQIQTKRAVLTVPATFTCQQRTATKDSALLAGFSSVKIITEASAAAIAYLNNATIPKDKILVFDLGECSFDLTLLEAKGKKISILAATTDTSVGGQNFTASIVKFICKNYREKNGGEQYHSSCRDKLWDRCESKKKELFNSNCETVQIGYAGYIRGNSTMTAETFYDLNNEILTKIETILGDFLQPSVSDLAEIGEVILVGGSTRIPKIETIIRKFLPMVEIRKSIDVEKVVANGAAIQANREAFYEHLEINKLPLPLFEPYLNSVNVVGIRTRGAIGVDLTYEWQIQRNNNSKFGVVIPTGTELPCFAEKCFWFPQGAVIRIFEGDDNTADRNDKLGQLKIDGIETKNPFCEIKIKMEFSINGELDVRAAYKRWGSNNWKFITINILHARSTHFCVHRPYSQKPKISSDHTTSAHTTLAGLYYQQKMEQVVSSLDYISDEVFKQTHDKSVEDAIEKASEAHPLTPELNKSTRDHLDTLFKKYTDINIRKKNSHTRFAIGFDFGTSFSSLAFVCENGLELIPDPMDLTSTPSCITFEEDDTTFGSVAQDQAYRNSENNVFDIKRMLGRHNQDLEIAQLRKFWPFRTSPENENICVDILEIQYRPEHLVTLYVRHLIENAAKFLNQDVINAVVAIPAYFTPRQRHLTKEAFHDAGINVLRLLDEPTAAALAYMDLLSDDSNKTCLVFDLGGGTFDVAIVEINGSTQLKIKAIDGDPFLGGADFDNALMKYCIEEFEKKHEVRFQDVGNYARNLWKLKKECEKAKEKLSFVKKATVSIEACAPNMDLVVEVDQSTFESLIEDKLNKCMVIVDRLVESVEISKVILVGGSTNIPRVLTLLNEKFGKRVIISKRLPPKEAVARGAALLAARIQNRDTSLSIFELNKENPQQVCVGAGPPNQLLNPLRSTPVRESKKKTVVRPHPSMEFHMSIGCATKNELNLKNLQKRDIQLFSLIGKL